MTQKLAYLPLFYGMSDIDQVLQISTVLGSPSGENWPEVSSMPDHGKILFKD